MLNVFTIQHKSALSSDLILKLIRSHKLEKFKLSEIIQNHSKVCLPSFKRVSEKVSLGLKILRAPHHDWR